MTLCNVPYYRIKDKENKITDYKKNRCCIQYSLSNELSGMSNEKVFTICDEKISKKDCNEENTEKILDKMKDEYYKETDFKGEIYGTNPYPTEEYCESDSLSLILGISGGVLIILIGIIVYFIYKKKQEQQI